MINKTLNKIFPVFAFVLSSCMNIQEIPYVITEPQCKIGQLENNYNFSGVCFTIYNNSNKAIKKIECTYTVFDADGDNPFIGSNCLISKFNDIIAPNDNREIIISLDKYMNYIPEEPFLIENFYVSKIEYSDGTVWKDSFGAFSQGGI